MGRFNIGSTVILLFEKNSVQWQNALSNDSAVIVGQEIAENKN